LLFVLKSDGSGSGQFFVAWVGPAIFGLDLGFENFPKIPNFFIFSPPGQKNLIGLGQKEP